MADLLPKIIEAAQKSAVVKVRCPRPARMAKELQRHLPNHDITTDEGRKLVVLKSRLWPDRSCATGPTCTPNTKPETK